MKPAPFRYHRPDSSDQVAELLAELGEDAKVIAGGQSLLPIMGMRLAEPSDLIDLTAVPELRRTEVEPALIRYGATTTHQMLEDGLAPDATAGLLRTAAAGIGYRAIRTRGTLGGSLAHADSSAEWPTVLAALDARVVARSRTGRRTVPVRDLLLGFFTTSLDAGEYIESIEVDRSPPEHSWGMHKSTRRAGEFAESLAVATGSRDPAGTLISLEVWLGAARDVPIRLPEVETLTAGADPGRLAVADLADPVRRAIGRDEDERARYAAHLHAATVLRAVQAIGTDER